MRLPEILPCGVRTCRCAAREEIPLNVRGAKPDKNNEIVLGVVCGAGLDEAAKPPKCRALARHPIKIVCGAKPDKNNKCA